MAKSDGIAESAFRTPQRTLRTSSELAASGLISAEKIGDVERVSSRYPIAVTPTIVNIIDSADPNDPIALQFIPDVRELDPAKGERPDPIGDISHSPVKGIVHRYPDRVLLTPLLHCPVYCRFCFRRERVGTEPMLSDAELVQAIDYVRQRSDIWEVIVTGGDPFMLSADRIKGIIRRIETIDHVAVIRFHTRVPIADPERVSGAILEALQTEKTVWVAVHCNHPRELSSPAEQACRRLVSAGIPLVGQTVLLKGVNDDVQTMEALLRAMVKNRIKPYYLHHLDLAEGTWHFRTTIADGQEIVRGLRGRVSGLCQPSYVLDIPGGFGKSPIGPAYLSNDGWIEDWQGEHHLLPLQLPPKSDSDL